MPATRSESVALRRVDEAGSGELHMPPSTDGLEAGAGEVELDPDAFVERYLALREASSEAQNAAVKLLSRDALMTSARRLGMLSGSAVMLGGEDEFAPLCDHAIYDEETDGATAVQRYWKSHRPKRGSIEADVCAAMLEAQYCLLEVEKVHPGVGIDAYDIILEDEYFIVDLNFGRTAKPGTFLASRVLNFDGFSITTGAAVPFSEYMIGDILAGIVKAQESAKSRRPRAIAAEMYASVIRACLSEDCEIGIQYEDAIPRFDGRGRGGRASANNGNSVRDLAARGSILSGTRAPRNGPCPCGSGLKFKKCCGKP